MDGTTETDGLTTADDVAWGQIQGQRKHQQDRAHCQSLGNGCHLLVLGDGMGGHVAGDIASATVIERFRDAFVNDGGESTPRVRLLQALKAANHALFDRIQENPRLAGMGTTLVAAAVEDRSLYWISVGDSPLWLFRNGEMRRLNENHSIGGLLDQRAAHGEITREEARKSAGRSQLLEAVMGDDIKLYDAPPEPLKLQSDDLIVLASDGIETCSPEELQNIVAERFAAAELVHAILKAVETHALPSQDNATLIVFRPNGDIES